VVEATRYGETEQKTGNVVLARGCAPAVPAFARQECGFR
jgi:hypothetical protein